KKSESMNMNLIHIQPFFCLPSGCRPPPKSKFSYAYWRVFRIKIQLAKLYQPVKTNGRVDISPVHHRMIVAITHSIRD
ncbi:hypothetical protein, partial [Escherichia coli]|uniref:hypothetical protein n=1 Tax=Escherichia coli TaxID=562 RepID=UPI0037DC80B0